MALWHGQGKYTDHCYNAAIEKLHERRAVPKRLRKRLGIVHVKEIGSFRTEYPIEAPTREENCMIYAWEQMSEARWPIFI